MKLKSLLIISALYYNHAIAMTLPSAVIKSYECEVCETLSHDNLSTHWVVENTLLNHITKHEASSLKYNEVVTLNALKNGVILRTLAPGAVIRIVPLTYSASLFKPQFKIVKDHSELPLHDAAQLMANYKDLDDSALSNEAMTIFQLKTSLGAGEFILKDASITGNKNDRYMIHVYDKNSTTYLTITTDKAFYNFGDKLTATVHLHDEVSGYPIDTIDARMVSPDGEVMPLVLEYHADDVYKAYLNLDSEKNLRGQHWYVEADIVAKVKNLSLKRHTHTAFSYAIPSAAITELKSARKEPFRFVATVNVATGSRYAIQAVLLATDSEGNKQPIETSQTAAWIAPGTTEMEVSFSPDIAKRYKGPYYLDSIQLIDYGQMKQVFDFTKSIDISKLG